MKNRLRISLITLLLSLLFSGCFALDSDDFYSLPKRSKEYSDLQNAVETAMRGGSYSAPVSGANRQALQHADLDGDGQEEVLVFCKLDGERPLKVLVLKRIEESYRLICTLEGDGTAFDSVQYAQIDGEPGMEILLCRRIGEQVQQFLSVYTLRNDTAAELMSSGYHAFTTPDLDGDMLTDIFLLRANSEGPRAFAELYRFRDGELRKDVEASLSTAADSVKRMLIGNVAQDIPAVFVASAYDENNLITDVFAMVDDHLDNISQNDESGQSAQTVRNYYVYSTDIDNNGVIEMPNTIPLEPLAGDPTSEGQYRIVWYNLAVDGTRTDRLTTYHNFAEGWFLYLPEAWCENLSVSKEPSDKGAPGTCFSLRREDGSVRRLVTIYAFTGENAQAKAEADGCFLLTQRGDVCYAARAEEDLGMSPDELTARFSFISVDLLPNEG